MEFAMAHPWVLFAIRYPWMVFAIALCTLGTAYAIAAKIADCIVVAHCAKMTLKIEEREIDNET